MRSQLVLVPVALAYTVLLLHSWAPDSLSLILPGSLQEGLSGECAWPHMLSVGRIGQPRTCLAVCLSCSADKLLCRLGRLAQQCLLPKHRRDVVG